MGQQEIYNEGRVVGLSAWELFYKQAIAAGVNPQDIPNEAQWLTAMIGSGASMVLKVPAGSNGICDFPLPTGSSLTAAGVIVASPFIGNCTWDDSNTWATKVTSYGALIENTSEEFPSSSEIPTGDYDASEYGNNVAEFAKITDGIVYTNNAKWVDAESQPPEKDINPNFGESSTVVRLYISSTIRTGIDVKVLLTGFNNKSILQSVSAYATGNGSGSTDTDNNDWVNGGMLGPEVIPWASKIIFAVPSAAYNLGNSLTRTLPSDAEYEAKTVGGITFKNVSATVKTNSLMDFDSINLSDYYTVHASKFSSSPTIQENATGVTLGINDSYSVLTAWYPGMTASRVNAATDSSNIFPPALYASQLTSTGTKDLVPIDVAAPGTIKGFTDDTQAYNYKTLLPDNYAVYYDSTAKTYSFVIPEQDDPDTWPGTAAIEYKSAPVVEVTAGTSKARMIALNDSNGTDYATTGAGGDILTSPLGKISWGNMLSALTANKCIDTLGNNFRNIGTELNSTNKMGVTNTITEVGANTVTLTGSSRVSLTGSTNMGTALATAASGTSYKSGTNFIEFSNGLRLYIAGGNGPGTTNVPVGSIGIGWT